MFCILFTFTLFKFYICNKYKYSSIGKFRLVYLESLHVLHKGIKSDTCTNLKTFLCLTNEFKIFNNFFFIDILCKLLILYAYNICNSLTGLYQLWHWNFISPKKRRKKMRTLPLSCKHQALHLAPLLSFVFCCCAPLGLFLPCCLHPYPHLCFLLLLLETCYLQT